MPALLTVQVRFISYQCWKIRQANWRKKKKSKPNNYWYKYKPKHNKNRKANCTRGITKIFILIRSNELEEKITLLTSETEMIPSPCGPNPSSIFPDKSLSLSYSSSKKKSSLKIENQHVDRLSCNHHLRSLCWYAVSIGSVWYNIVHEVPKAYSWGPVSSLYLLMWL